MHYLLGCGDLAIDPRGNGGGTADQAGADLKHTFYVAKLHLHARITDI